MSEENFANQIISAYLKHKWNKRRNMIENMMN